MKRQIRHPTYSQNTRRCSHPLGGSSNCLSGSISTSAEGAAATVLPLAAATFLHFFPELMTQSIASHSAVTPNTLMIILHTSVQNNYEDTSTLLETASTRQVLTEVLTNSSASSKNKEACSFFRHSLHRYI